jgi:hypothetical protein
VTLIAAARIRDAGPDDYPALRTLAAAAFPAETLIDPGLYRQLLASHTILVRLLTTDQGPAGYYALWPLTAPAYARLQRADIHERDLNAGDIVPIYHPQASVLYLSDLCLAPAAPSVILLRDLRATLLAALRAHPRITHLAAWAFSPQGARLAARFGMLPVPQNPALVQTSATSIVNGLAASRRRPR